MVNPLVPSLAQNRAKGDHGSTSAERSICTRKMYDDQFSD
jgi:hypothetical protein